MYLKTNIAKESAGLFRLKNRLNKKLSFEEIKQNDFMSEKRKKRCRALNYLYHFFLFICDVSCHVSISAFASLVGVSV